MTVTGGSPIVDPERAGISVNINNQALTTVPVTTNRRFQDAWLMVPGVNVNPATQELTGSERRTSLDGADVTDPFGGDIFAVNLNYDAIQDVEIKALGAEAADGSSMVGQFMNIVTKSSGNNFHGSAALFTIPQDFNDSNVQGIPANRREDYYADGRVGHFFESSFAEPLPAPWAPANPPNWIDGPTLATRKGGVKIRKTFRS